MRKHHLQRRILALVLAAMTAFFCIACAAEPTSGEVEVVTKKEKTPTETPAKPTDGTQKPTDGVAEPTGESAKPTTAPAQGTTELTGSSGTAAETKPMDETMRAAYATFAYQLFAACAKSSGGEAKNCLLSPFSVYTALAMLANGANGNTAAQIDQVLGLDEASRNAYMAAWLASLTGQEDISFTCADSVWVSNLFRNVVLDSFLGRCADSYHAEVYAADMNDGTVDDINAWTDRNTKSMIQKILEHGDLTPETVTVLLNAITLEAKWMIPFDNENTLSDAVFTHEDGTTENVEMLRGEADRCYLENEFVTGCAKSYKGGEFRHVALLPKEGVSVDEVIAKLTAESVDALFANAIRENVSLQIPKYTVEYRQELQDVLAALGMGDAFTPAADLTRMISTGNTVVDRVIHKTYLALDNEGTRAAAVTAITTRNMSISKTYRVTLDRPFVYMITDGNNLPIFIGTYR